MAFVRGMLAGMAGRGLDARAFAADSGIDLANSATRLPIDFYAAFYNRVIAELGDEGFGLFSEPMRPGSFEFLCRAMLGAETLAEALDRGRRFLAIVLPDLEVEIHRHADDAQLRIRERRQLSADPGAAGRVFAFEWLLRLLHGLSCWLVGRGLALDSVSFPYPRPPHADDYALVYTERSDFGAGHLVARFRANLLDLPLRRDEAALQEFLQGAPGKISMLYRRDRNMVFRVRDLLRAALADNPGIEQIATAAHMSARTLHRRLRSEGSSFRAIKDAIRRDLALARLTKTDRPIADIAAELGYADTSAFYRAFTAWTGVSPQRFRRQLHAQHVASVTDEDDGPDAESGPSDRRGGARG